MLNVVAASGPVEGARLDVEFDDQQAFGVAFEIGGVPVSDTDGRFELTGVPPCELRLTAVRDGYLEASIDLGTVGDACQRGKPPA